LVEPSVEVEHDAGANHQEHAEDCAPYERGPTDHLYLVRSTVGTASEAGTVPRSAYAAALERHLARQHPFSLFLEPLVEVEPEACGDRVLMGGRAAHVYFARLKFHRAKTPGIERSIKPLNLISHLIDIAGKELALAGKLEQMVSRPRCCGVSGQSPPSSREASILPRRYPPNAIHHRSSRFVLFCTIAENSRSQGCETCRAPFADESA